MKIHSKKTGFYKIIIPIAVIISLLLYSIQLTYDKSFQNDKVKIREIESSTDLFNTVNMEEMITKGINQIHRDSICTMFINNQLGTPYLYYVYKDPITPELLSDRTYLHIHLKDKSKLEEVGTSKFINLDFTKSLKELQIDGRKYFFHQTPLTNEYLKLNNIDFINTGRYRYRRGQSYSVKEIKIDNIAPIEISADLEKIIISIKEKGLNKIKKKRADALKNGVLSSGENDLIKAEISSEKNIGLKSLIRLKGDWTDHLRDTLKWSYKVGLENDKTLYGMRKFSIQHPITRNYAWEWLFLKIIKENELMGLRYDFLNVELQIEKKDRIETKQIGIMAIEESIDKILIENNKRREGVIISFDETLLWEDRKRQRDLHLPENNKDVNARLVKTAPIRVFNENRVLATPGLKKQFDTAKNLLHALRKGELTISEVFDVEKLSMFVALSNLFGGHHGLIWHNLKIYYNPVTNKLEPVASDSNSGYKIEEIRQYVFSKDDPVYQQKLVEKLEMVSSEKFVQTLYNRNYEELNSLMSILKSEFKIDFDHSVLEHNSNLIKKQIYPANSLISHLSSYDSKNISLDVKNITRFPISLGNLQTEKGKVLSKSTSENVIWPGEKKRINLPLKRAFLNAFISKKNKRGEFRYPKDISKINLAYAILGSSYQRHSKIIPFNEENIDFARQYIENLESNLELVEFISVNEEDKTIRFQSGEHSMDHTIRIPANYTVVVEKGFSLDFKNNSSLISYSPIICRATKKSPINFYSSDSTGGGIFVSNASEKSILEYCNFSNLSYPEIGNWSLTGAVNFNESDVIITNSVFEKNRSEDGLNIIRSYFTMDFVTFKNTQSDAFDGDFVEGKLTNCMFLNCGNDGIDVSGSNLEITHVEVINSSDKAISIGEGSTLKGSGIKIEGGEIGVVSKDLSVIELNDVHIKNSRLAFSCFQKKNEFGPGKMAVNDLVLENIEIDHLIEENSELSIDNKLVETKSKKVVDLMYGNEYGKSSR